MESTNLLMVVAVLAVLASGIGVVMSLVALPSAGYASSDLGNVTFEIESLISVQFTNNLINWSTGYVNTTGPSPCVNGVEAQLATDVTGEGAPAGTGVNGPIGVFCGIGWQPQLQGLTLASLSNQDINVTLTSDSNAITLIDGVGNNFGSNFRWKVSDNKTSTCNSAFNPLSYSEIVQGQNVIACDSMNFENTHNAFDIDFYVNISDQAAQIGYQKAVITATAERSDTQVGV